MTDRKIKVDIIQPPIPIRQYDWMAYYEGTEEGGPRGWGATPEAAIENLKSHGDGDA